MLKETSELLKEYYGLDDETFELYYKLFTFSSTFLYISGQKLLILNIKKETQIKCASF